MTSPSKRASGPYRPTRLGQWEVVAKIAGGGMSAVYLGRRVDPDSDLPSVVALKIVRHEAAKDARFVQMFLEEGHLLARLVHPNIVRTLEVGADAEQDFIAMELMLGKTFSAIYDALVERNVRLNPDIAAWTAARIADALHYAHELADEHGRPLALVHRDVNPANVFATFDGEVKLFDFGLAKSTADENKGSRIVAGKLSYLSPEQIMQMPLDRRSDVFSLGTTLWELLTSRRLFRRDTDVETVRAVQLGPIPDVRAVASELPEELARIVRTALERNRDHRYATTAQMARELDAFVYSRNSAENVTSRLAKLVDTLFPDEQKRQNGWLKPTISARPGAMVRRDSRETTAVMVNAPARPTPGVDDAPPSSVPVTMREPPPSLVPRSANLAPTLVPRSMPVPSRPPPPVPRSMPPPPPSSTDVQAGPPALAKPPAGDPRPGLSLAPRPKKAPIPLPSGSRPSAAPPRPAPRPSQAPPAKSSIVPQKLSVPPPKISAPPPPKVPPRAAPVPTPFEAALAEDTTEMDELAPVTVVPDGDDTRS